MPSSRPNTIVSMAVRADAADARRRLGAAILVGAMVVTTVFGQLVSLFFPEGDDGHYTYHSIEPDRTFFRTWLILAAVNLVVGVTAFALVGWLLVPARGWIIATAGACLMWVGCALYAVGVGGIATLYYFGADPAALDPAAGARLLDHLDDSFLAVWGPAIGGAVPTALGQIALAVGLWRAATVPRWIPILAFTIALTFVLPDAGVAGFFVELPSSLSGLGLAWYFWKRHGGSAPPSAALA
jgi:hypothetical protein